MEKLKSLVLLEMRLERTKVTRCRTGHLKGLPLKTVYVNGTGVTVAGIDSSNAINEGQRRTITAVFSDRPTLNSGLPSTGSRSVNGPAEKSRRQGSARTFPPSRPVVGMVQDQAFRDHASADLPGRQVQCDTIKGSSNC